MLSCVGDGLFDLCVSDQLLDEIERVLIDVKGLSREKARTFRSAVLASAATIVTTVQCDSIRDQLDGPEHSRDSPRAGAATRMLRSRRNFELSTPQRRPETRPSRGPDLGQRTHARPAPPLPRYR